MFAHMVRRLNGWLGVSQVAWSGPVLELAKHNNGYNLSVPPHGPERQQFIQDMRQRHGTPVRAPATTL